MRIRVSFPQFISLPNQRYNNFITYFGTSNKTIFNSVLKKKSCSRSIDEKIMNIVACGTPWCFEKEIFLTLSVWKNIIKSFDFLSTKKGIFISESSDRTQHNALATTCLYEVYYEGKLSEISNNPLPEIKYTVSNIDERYIIAVCTRCRLLERNGKKYWWRKRIRNISEDLNSYVICSIKSLYAFIFPYTLKKKERNVSYSIKI